MAAQFDAAEALLKEIQAETAAVRTAVEEQNEKVIKVTADVEAAVKDMRESENRTRDEMREIREEVNTVREMLPKVSLVGTTWRARIDFTHPDDGQEQGEPQPEFGRVTTGTQVSEGAPPQSRPKHVNRSINPYPSRKTVYSRLAAGGWTTSLQSARVIYASPSHSQ